MANDQPSDILGELMTLEHNHLARRLLESTVFIPDACVADLRLVQRLAESSRRHEGELAGLIQERGGAVPLRRPDVDSADLHFQDLGSAMPRLIAAQEALVRAFVEATHRLGGDAACSAVSLMLTRHNKVLDELKTDPAPAEPDAASGDE